jgi:excisionase family DNA binding protein
MGQVSVAEAARRLGVGVSRMHQRIADGSLPATRVGSQWIIDEAALAPLAELRPPGRLLSQRSAWALVAASQDNQLVLDVLASVERSRARDRLRRILMLAMEAPSEAQIHAVAALLRSWLHNRAGRQLYRASPRDLSDLREDDRTALSGVSHASSGIAAGDLVEGYIDADHLAAVVDDYLLSPAGNGRDANVVLHVVSAVIPAGIGRSAPLTLAADLAEHRSPREEARAAEILREIGGRNPELVAQRPKFSRAREKART